MSGKNLSARFIKTSYFCLALCYEKRPVISQNGPFCPFLAHHHKHNAKEKWAVLIKWATSLIVIFSDEEVKMVFTTMC